MNAGLIVWAGCMVASMIVFAIFGILLWRCACQWWGEALDGIAASVR